MDRSTDNECGICFEAMTMAVPLQCCSQRVCKTCFLKIMEANPRCPYCAARLQTPRETSVPPENPIDMLVCASAVLALFCCVITTGVFAGLPIH